MLSIKKYAAIDIGSNAVRLLISNIIEENNEHFPTQFLEKEFPFWLTGYVNKLENESIIFGNRERKSVTNTISGKLSFNTKSSLGLSFRYYWSPVKYDQKFYELDPKGTLINSNYLNNHDINYNIWDLDLSYSWEFAPGSQLVVLYRNSIFNSDDLSSLNFRKNLNNLFKKPNTNKFSLKLIYYLDYNNLKNWL